MKKIEMFPGEYGYTFPRREPDGPVEVWRERDDVLVMFATEYLYAFQWAYVKHHGLLPHAHLAECLSLPPRRAYPASR